MPGATTKYSVPYPLLTDPADIETDGVKDTADAIDQLLAPSTQGVLASRPAFGKTGRTYLATDVGILFRDNGTSWDTVLTGVGHAALLGLSTDGVVRRGKSIIAGAGTRTNTAFGALNNGPDQVANLVLPANGLITIYFRAYWNSSAAGAGEAEIFLGANALKGAQAQNAGPVTPSAGTFGTVNNWLTSWEGGLRGTDGTTTGVEGTDSTTTGLILGAFEGATPFGGACVVEAAAGTYTVSVQFRASSGTVTATNRKLWVKAEVY